MKQDNKQLIWETWFLMSVFIFMAYFFVGMLEGSREFFPNWIYFFGVACINLILCVGYGFKKD